MPPGPLIAGARLRSLVIAILMAGLLAAALGGAALLSADRAQAHVVRFTPLSVQGLTLSAPENWDVGRSPLNLSGFRATVYLENPDEPTQTLTVAAVTLDEPTDPRVVLSRAVELLVLSRQPDLRLGGGLELSRTGPLLHAATSLIANDGPRLLDHHLAAVTVADDGRTYWVVALTGPTQGRSTGNRATLTGDPRTAALFHAILDSARVAAADPDE